MLSLNKGSIEYVKVTVGDSSATPITDLSTHTPQFKVTTADELTDIIALTGAVASDMVVYCLVDTTGVGFVIGEYYKLYVEFDATPQFPVLGPVSIKIV